MILLRLAYKSLLNRKGISLLTSLSIALSVGLLMTVDLLREATKNGFTQTISQTDLIVGARGGGLQLVLYSVFNMGQPTNNVGYDTFQKYSKHSAVQWTIPYSLGDSHKGFRVVATNEDFFKHYRYRQKESVSIKFGQPLTAESSVWDVVIGHDVAEKLNYKVGDKIVLTHGVTQGVGIIEHEDKPFVVIGIMSATGTPLDRAVYITLEGMEAIHIDWQNGAVPTKDKMISQQMIKKENLKISSITSFFLRTHNRIEVLSLQREINNDSQEPLTAVIPGVMLNQLWNSLGFVEKVLKGISILVLIVGLFSLFISLTSTLNERQKEMSILRSLGANFKVLFLLLVVESLFLTFVGIVLGVGVSLGGLVIFRPILENQFGVYLDNSILFNQNGGIYLVVILTVGVMVGFLPALININKSLKNGLAG